MPFARRTIINHLRTLTSLPMTPFYPGYSSDRYGLAISHKFDPRKYKEKDMSSTAGTMKLYSHPLSPFAARVRLSIYRKGLNIDIVPPPEGGIKSDAFLALNPIGRIPTLVLDNGFAIPESATILEYLEDAFPTPSLRPTDALELARVRLFLRLPDIYFENAPRILLGMRKPADRQDKKIQPAMEALNRGLSYIDHYVGGGDWAVGAQASIADCALVPVLNAVSSVERVYGQPDLISKYSKLGAYWQVAKTDGINAKVIAEQLAAIPKD